MDDDFNLPVFAPAAIAACVGIADLLDPVAQALIGYSAGRAERPPLQLLRFAGGGEAHVKSGYLAGERFFVTKIATMCSGNRLAGRPTSDGVMLLCSAKTGAPLALLHDRKYLTDIRTAAVGALAARLLAPDHIRTVGVFGTGGQAFLQVEALKLVRSFERVLIWGRDPDRGARLSERLRTTLPTVDVRVETDAQQVVRASEVLITATAAEAPIIEGRWLRPGTHITALGADDAQKWELDATCFERARLLLVDSRELAERFGDIPHCRRTAPHLPITITAELGEVLGGRMISRAAGDITISKHVGLGIEDLAAATTAYERLTAG